MSSFSVFIPVYNEESLIVENTEKLLVFLESLNMPFEIIIGSNGSDDRTVLLGEQLQTRHPQVRFFHIPHRAPGDALNRALDLSRYGRIITADMDLSVDLEYIRRANDLLDQYDLVVGSKRMGSQRRSMIRKFGSALYVFTAMILLGLSFDDYSLAAKGYRKKVLEGCRDRIHGGTFYVVEVLYYATNREFQIVQIPASCHDTRVSRYNLIHEGFYRFAKLFQLWLRR